jgi:omega-hydroxy-beta-dihydromenaquinone-9 sulfotransferase
MTGYPYRDRHRSAMSAAPSAGKKTKNREWAPRIWEGCNFPAWFRLLARNRFAVHPAYWYIAAIISGVSGVHSLLRLIEEILYRPAVAATKINHSPLFVIGHWRTGTTLLHELLILDPRHTFPNTYQCLEPNHFLLTEKLFSKTLAFLLPSRRPMDNMAAGWDKPQEDEFALCMLGTPSPYLSIAFPNRPPIFDEYLDLESVPRREREKWKKALFCFLQKLTFKDPRRLVLKSPPHTSRIPILLEMFPDAKFVHIVRNPYVVYPSTVNLWKAFHRKHGLQKPEAPWLEEHVFTTLSRMYEHYEAGKKRLDPSRLHELKYEDLVRDPVGEMRNVYEKLKLGGFEAVQPRIEAYFAEKKDYSTNKYELTPALREQISKRWGEWIRKWGYDSPG